MEFNLLHATKIEILESTNAKYKRQIEECKEINEKRDIVRK